MEQVYINALYIIETKIKFQGQVRRTALDEFTAFHSEIMIDYYTKLKRSILKRSGLTKNVIYVDFQAKKRVA